MNPTDGHQVAGVLIDKHRFLGRVKVTQLFQMAPDPRDTENRKIVESSKELEIKDAHSAVLKGKYVKQVLTYSGKKIEAEFKFPYNPACEEAKLISAVVASKTGQRQEISTNEINVMDAGWNASAKRYTGGKILVANLPGVDIGSTIEVQYQLTTKGKPFVSGFESFQTMDELGRKTFRLAAPADVRMRLAGRLPRVVLSDSEGGALAAAAEALEALGLKTVVCDPTEAPSDRERVIGRRANVSSAGRAFRRRTPAGCRGARADQSTSAVAGR